MVHRPVSIFLILILITALFAACKAVAPKETDKTAAAAKQPQAATPRVTPARAVPSPSEAPSHSPVSKASEAQNIPAKKVSTSALSNVRYGFGMKRVKNSPPEVGGKYLSYFPKYGAYYIGDINSKDLYLTFDEGYENGYTAKILDVLKANDVKACFFITMPYLRNSFDLVKRMVDEGHEVGNHTVNHPSMPEVTDDVKLENELLDLDREFFERTGKSMRFVRPPKGEFSERTLAITKQLGYNTIFWSFAYADWDVKSQKGAQYAYNTFMDYIHGGAIILLHAVSKDNAEALDSILKDAKKQGYVFKSLAELK